MFGPTIDIKQTLKDCESKKADACSITVSQHKTHEFMESWFIKLNQKIFMSNWFYEFINSVKHEKTKSDVTIKYEHGLTNLIINHNCSWNAVYSVYGRATYNKPKLLFKNKIPFVKKMSFTRHNGACGNQIKYILNHCDKSASKAIMNSANRLYGKQYMNWFLTNNPIKIFNRNLTYAIKKLKNGGI